MNTKSKVAVIGLGNIGTIVASNLVKGNRPVIVADRSHEKAKKLAKKLGALAKPAEIASAIQEADIVVLAIWFEAIKEIFVTYKKELQNKIIVDPSNPIAPDPNGGFKKIIGDQESAGQILSALLPDGARLVKALGTLGARSLSDMAFQRPERAVLFYTADDKGVNREVEELIRDNGFEPVKVGAINQSIRIEVFGDLHEFGALGRTITLSETNQVTV